MNIIYDPELAKFETVSKYADQGIILPKRATTESAGYDMYVAEDTLIPPYDFLSLEMIEYAGREHIDEPRTLEEMAALTKAANAKVTLVSTGVKCKLPSGFYLKLVARSSLPLKHWLIVGNGVGRQNY